MLLYFAPVMGDNTRVLTLCYVYVKCCMEMEQAANLVVIQRINLLFLLCVCVFRFSRVLLKIYPLVPFILAAWNES